MPITFPVVPTLLCLFLALVFPWAAIPDSSCTLTLGYRSRQTTVEAFSLSCRYRQTPKALTSTPLGPWAGQLLLLDASTAPSTAFAGKQRQPLSVLTLFQASHMFPFMKPSAFKMGDNVFFWRPSNQCCPMKVISNDVQGKGLAESF